MTVLLLTVVVVSLCSLTPFAALVLMGMLLLVVVEVGESLAFLVAGGVTSVSVGVKGSEYKKVYNTCNNSK